MAKKKNCRRTTDEAIIHEKAVRMRKKTDEQLVHYLEDRAEKARSEGIHEGRKQGLAEGKKGMQQGVSARIEEIMAEIGKIKGIGENRLSLIRAVIESRLN